MSEGPAEQVNGGFTAEDIQRMIDERVADARKEMQQERDQMRRDHAREMDELRASMAGITASPVATHAGGPGVDIAPTWSAYDQLLATQGEHPWQNGEHADWLVHPDHVENRQPVPWS